jgi:hypothetical protein
VAIWYILWMFGTFFPFWYVVARKIWQPWSEVCSSNLKKALASLCSTSDATEGANLSQWWP